MIENQKKEKVYEVDTFEQTKKFKDDIEDDLELFDEILDQLEDLNLVDNDPKIDSAAEKIEEIMEQTKVGEPKRKVVIFSEYLDTVKYLAPKLKKHFPDRVLSIDGSLSDSRVEEILQNFDAGHDKQKDDYDILLATDKISEGFNLNRAGAIINYDIPWNPTRVIQRLGRINRIGNKVFDNLYIYNFFPTETGADFVRSKQIAKEKMFLIHNTLGEDAKIFEPDEDPSASGLYQKLQENPEDQEEESFYTKVKNKLKDIEENHPEVAEKAINLSPRVKTAMESDKDTLTLFVRKGRGFYVRQQNYENDDINESGFEKVYEEIKCDKDKNREELSDEFWDRYDNLKNYKGENKQLGTSSTSIRSKARTNLKNLKKKDWKNFKPLLPFVRVLLKDMMDYGTLSQYTLRRISELDTYQNDKETEEEKQEIIEEIKGIKKRLGEDYLEELKEQTKELSKEVIIAIEQQSNE